MRLLVLGLLASGMAMPCSFYWPAIVAGAGVQTADMLSSRGMHETNPALGRGRFGWRQAGVKSAAYAGISTGVWLAVRKDERACRVASYAMVGASGFTVGITVRNWRRR